MPPQLTALCSPQVKSVNLSDGEVLSIRGVDGDALVVLANQTLLVEGQVIRSPTNTISVYFRTFQDDVVGTFQLHYQGGCVPDTDRGLGSVWAQTSHAPVSGPRASAGVGRAVVPRVQCALISPTPVLAVPLTPTLPRFCPRAAAPPAHTHTASLFFTSKSFKK